MLIWHFGLSGSSKCGPIPTLDHSARTDALAETAMMAPLPTPSHANDRPESPWVRLEVRVASGLPVTYEVGADDFLIGGSAGCDLRGRWPISLPSSVRFCARPTA